MIAPASPPTFFKSAIGLFRSSRYSRTSGSCQSGSLAARPASMSFATSRSSLPITPAKSVPSAARHEPVSVARSITASGFSREARASASARTSRPSASVLSTSTVLPLRKRMTSPGFCAWPPGRFSVAGTKAVTSTGRPRRAAAATAPITAAPPAMSYFMVSIDLGGLSESPPESKVIPLPTRITRRRAPGPAQRSRMKRGSSRLPRATASRPVRPSLAMRFGAHASASRPRMSRASAATRSARKRGVATDAGSFTRSRARKISCTTAPVAASGAPSCFPSPTSVSACTRGRRSGSER